MAIDVCRVIERDVISSAPTMMMFGLSSFSLRPTPVIVPVDRGD